MANEAQRAAADHLERLCDEAEAPLDGPLAKYCEPSDYVLLVLPRDKLPRGAAVRLAGTVGPRGDILNVKGEGPYEVCARFDIRKVRRFIKEIREGKYND